MKPLLYILCVPSLLYASLANVYLAASTAGGDTGVSCADAHAPVFFNTAGNWGGNSSQIGSDSVVHVCGSWTGGNATTFLTFQGNGTSGHPVTVLFESGASMHPNYCNGYGCIDLNGKSYIVINGGTTCGETGKWTTTQCNGQIQNALAGSTGATCLGGACSPLGGSTPSTGIGNSSGSPTNIEMRNLRIHAYTRLASDTSDSGMSTSGIGMGNGAYPQGFKVHNMVIDGVGKAFVLSMGSTTGTFSGYEMYNSNVSDQCWAMGIGTDGPDMEVRNLQFHDNEVSNWDNWAPANTTGNVCHPNGTMWFNGNSYTVHMGTGFIGYSESSIYNNYLHGALCGNSPLGGCSGYLSCQDNCIDISVFNNLVVDDSTGPNGGGAIYFNGPGGGGQKVYNNTVIRPCCSMIVSSAVTSNIVIKNNILRCTGTNCAAIEIRPNTPTVVTSDFNDGYQIGSGSWTVYNSGAAGSFRSLSTWQSTYGQDLDSITANPLLDGSSKLQLGSGAIGIGANLTSLGIAGLNVDAAGVSRPSSGGWDVGAYQFDATTAVPVLSVAGKGVFSGIVADSLQTSVGGEWHGKVY